MLGAAGDWQVGGEGETYAWGEKWWESVYDSSANLNGLGDQVKPRSSNHR